MDKASHETKKPWTPYHCNALEICKKLVLRKSEWKSEIYIDSNFNTIFVSKIFNGHVQNKWNAIKALSSGYNIFL